MKTPVVALTFDDGPSEWTEPLLDVLAANEARATFFVLGTHIAGREETLARMTGEGHEIGVHGWDHTRLSQREPAQLIRQQLRKTELQIVACGAPKPILWRPPWLYAPGDAVRAAESLGYRQVGVTIDGRDVSVGEGAIVRQVLGGLDDGSIVGLHDGIAPNGEQYQLTREPTVRAVRRLLERCISVTVSELLALRAAA